MTPSPLYARTKREIKMDWTCHRMTWNLIIPKGTRCKKITEGATIGRYWIDDLSWIDRKENGFLYHDAYHYGIDIDASEVEGA